MPYLRGILPQQSTVFTGKSESVDEPPLQVSPSLKLKGLGETVKLITLSPTVKLNNKGIRSMKNFVAGTTVDLIWQSSGTTVSSVGFSVFDGSETAVDSGYMTSSGNGHYYGFYTSTTSKDAYYTVRFDAYVSGRLYRSKTRFRTILDEVD